MKSKIKDNIKVFYSNGQLGHKGTIINHKNEGLWECYYESGLLGYRGYFFNNKKIGYWEFKTDLHTKTKVHYKTYYIL